MQEIKFGTGGWRAVIGEDFTQKNVRRVAEGISLLLHEKDKIDKPVVIGYDHRFLSEDAAKWVAEVFAYYNIDTMFIDCPVPTPLVMHAVKRYNLNYGIEITASHNPYRYNGIKLFVEEGRDASLDVTSHLEDLILTTDGNNYISFKDALGLNAIKIVDKPFEPFIQDIIKVIDIEAIRKRHPYVLFDPMHGVGLSPLQAIFDEAGCDFNIINGSRDAYFGGLTPAPAKETLGALTNLVVKHGYDFGIAMDGDGDRLGIIDSDGKYINANEILCLLYYYLVKFKGWRGPVVRNLATTHMLDKIAESFGEKCYEVPIGFKFISSKIDEVDAVLGGESSGGLTVRGHIHGKDSIYAASLFTEMFSVTNKSPSELLAELQKEYGSYATAEDNLKFEAGLKNSIENKLMVEKRLPVFKDEIVKVNYEDGCKVYFEDGWVICRFSGTEPLLRIFAESTSEERALEYIKVFKDFIF